MSSKPLQTQSLLDLIDLFERSGQPIADGDGQRLHGVPGWELSRKATLSDRDLAAWTECVGYAGCYPAPCGDEHILVDIEEDSDPGLYRYRCPETWIGIKNPLGDLSSGELLFWMRGQVVHNHFAEVKCHLCFPNLLWSQAGTASKLSARALFELS